MCHEILRDAKLYDQLLRIDNDLAAKARVRGCPCGGRLHSARYPRKPRGALVRLGPEYDKRLSFCCDREGCRRRVTPPSVRFLGRRVYLGAVVVLVTTMANGVSGQRAGRLKELFGVDRRTVERWRSWWRERFVDSGFWRVARGLLMPPVDAGSMPESLLARFGGDERAKLVNLLSFIAPITTRAPT